jgi:putative two-component system response regulator
MIYKILVIEDLEHINKLICSYLENEGYLVFAASNGKEGLKLFKKHFPDLVITDVVMPEKNGYDVCRQIKSNERTRLVPVVLLTSLDDNESYIKGMDVGADDFLIKPINKFLFLARINSLLRVKKLNDKLDNSWNLLFSLARVVEAKDKTTEDHTQRVGDLSKKFGEYLNLSDEESDTLYKGGVLHDIGKIGIPDVILNKSGKLTPAEYEMMKKHTTIGKEICEPLQSMNDVIDIVLYHHEKWDGSGYPKGLKGKKIPLFAQIVSISDYYDAITSHRQYRKSFSKDAAVKHLLSEQNKSFDSKLVDIFINNIIS